MTALMVLATLMVPMVGTASAGHTAAHDLDCIEEIDTNPAGVGSTHTVNCTVSGLTTGSGESVEVDAEIQGVNTSDENTDDDANPGSDTSFTPKQPDFTDTCTEGGAGTCSVQFIWTGINPGQDTLTAWIDDDQDNSTFTEPGPGGTADADGTEGQCAVLDENTSGCSPAVPGNKSEPDDTDVVIKNWVSTLPVDATLDCDDDGAPGDVADAPNSEQATNPAGEGELYTCLVWNDNGAGAGGTQGNGIQDGSEAGISGVKIDAENLNGANDPDTANQGGATGAPNNGTADYNDACTSGADGRCTYTLNPTENELGTANVCFWTDEDSDAIYNVTGDQNDGGGCDGEVFGGEGNDGAGQKQTDVVQKTWATAGQGSILDAEPENDANAQGTQHTVTATTYDAFGNVAPGTPVDFVIRAGSRNDSPTGSVGGNDRVICDNVVSNAQGVATCTYTDEGTGTDPIAPGTSEPDTIDVCISTNAPGFFCAGGFNDAAVQEPERNNNSDRVAKNWFNTVPTATTIQVDMVGPQQFPPAGCGATFDSTDANPVNTGHVMCAEVRDNLGQPLVGQQVTFTINGVGDFYNDANGNNAYDPANGDTIIGKTVTESTDNNGEAFAQLTSSQAGNSEVTATTGTLSASGTKTWQSALLRTLDCEPETAENEVNDPHTIICNAKDVNGNNVQGAVITVYENGPGSIQNGPANFGPCGFYGTTQTCYTYTTDSSGNIQVIVNSSTEGTMTIEAADANDVGDSRSGAGGTVNDNDDPCDQRANESDAGGGVGTQPGAPAGQCFDAVTKDYVEEDTECDDGVDNDGDGFVDFGDDPGCESADDDSEAPFNQPEPTRERVDRKVKIQKDKHVRLGRGKKALMIKGVVRVPGVDNSTRDLCGGSVPVKVQIRAGGEWITRKSDTTNANYSNKRRGHVFKVLIRDVAARYRAIAPKFQIDDPDTNRELRCLKAQDKRRHRH